MGLYGCATDYEKAKIEAIAIGQEQCKSEGKEFDFISSRIDAEHRAVVIISHCLGPGDRGYVPPTPQQH
jgi:hypothetical protein